MQTATASLRINDWNRTWSIEMDAPWSASVAEVVDEARREAGLPQDVTYRALQRDRQLSGLETLRDAGVEEDVDIEIVPEVIAGKR